MIANRRTRYVAAAVLAVAGTVACSDTTDRASQAGAGADSPEGVEGMEGMVGMDTEAMDQQSSDMGGMNMDGSVRLTANEVATFGVTFDTAAVRPLTRRIRTVGAVGFDETNMAYVAPRFGGWAERLHVDFTGQRVREGQPLLEVYSPELVAAQEELLLAARMIESVGESQLEDVADGARDLLASARRRLAYWDITDEQVRQLLEVGEVRRTLTIHAPVSGIVMEKGVFAGQAFQAGTNLYMIADLSDVWVNAEIFESDAPLVREGMPAEISVAALPGEALSGTIAYVYPTLEDRTRSMRARITVPNPGAKLKPGMYATVELRTELDAFLTVPTSAVLHSGERTVAFVDMGGGEIMPHELRLGLHGEGYVQVLEGLEAGDRVVTSAQFLLDSESNLAEVMKAMMAQMNISDMDGMDGMEGMEGMEMDADQPMEMPEGMDMDSMVPDSGGGR
jgi:RND family efflux transporter MFP subunit